MKPILRDHDHEEYFTKSVECGCCGQTIGSWEYGRLWCNGDKEWFIDNHKFCQYCGDKIDWSEEQK